MARVFISVLGPGIMWRARILSEAKSGLRIPVSYKRLQSTGVAETGPKKTVSDFDDIGSREDELVG